MYNYSRSGASSPLPEPVTTSRRKYSRLEISRFSKFCRYIGRLFKFNHMDFEFALWQMIYLFTAPSKVFRNTYYRKQTKNQYSRDDPAFLVLLTIWFIISASCLSLSLHLPFYSFIKFLIWVVFVDCIGLGLIVATIYWVLANKILGKNSTEQVEWAFAFDIHLNAFFPPLVIIHFFQVIVYSIFVEHEHFFARFFSNTLFMVAITYYFYITFLGYSSLPYLNKTKIVLYPLIPFFFLYLITTLIGPNICMLIMVFYEKRIY